MGWKEGYQDCLKGKKDGRNAGNKDVTKKGRREGMLARCPEGRKRWREGREGVEEINKERKETRICEREEGKRENTNFCFHKCVFII